MQFERAPHQPTHTPKPKTTPQHNTTSTLVLFNADRPCQLLHGPPHGRPIPQWLSTAQQRKKKDLLARGLRPPTPAVPVLAFPEEISKSWGVKGGLGVRGRGWTDRSG